MKRSLIGALLTAALMWTGGAQAYSGNPTFAAAGCNTCHNTTGGIAPGFTGGGGPEHTAHAQTRGIACTTCHTAGFTPPPIANCGTCHPNKIGNPVLAGKHNAVGVTVCANCHGLPATTTTTAAATTTTTTAATTTTTAAATTTTAAATTTTSSTTTTTAAAGFPASCGGCHALPTVAGTGGMGSPGVCAASYNDAAMGRMANYGLTVAQQQALKAAMCGGGGTTTTSGGTTTTGSTTSTTVATGGAALFNSYCAACHTGAAAGGGGRQVVGARTCSINASLNGTKVFRGGVPQMAFLKSMLSAAQIQSISDYLNSGTVTGQQRYITACAGCHGVDARGGRVGEGVRGSDAREISGAIRENEGGMGIMNCLPSSDISAIAAYLNGQTATTTTTRASTTTTRWGTTTTTRRFNPPATHTDPEHGYYHMPGKNSPYTNGCTTCHGATLQGGFAPSCYTCHGKKWSESGGSTTTTRASTTTTRSTTSTTRMTKPTSFPNGAGTCAATAGSHTAVLGAAGSMQRNHMPGYATPLTSGCTGCHGANLQGTTMNLGCSATPPSCYTCHGAGKWDATNKAVWPAWHTSKMEGYPSGPGYENPIQNGCATCHGVNGQLTRTGSTAISCYTCHGKEW